MRAPLGGGAASLAEKVQPIVAGDRSEGGVVAGSAREAIRRADVGGDHDDDLPLSLAAPCAEADARGRNARADEGGRRHGRLDRVPRSEVAELLIALGFEVGELGGDGRFRD